MRFGAPVLALTCVVTAACGAGAYPGLALRPSTACDFAAELKDGTRSQPRLVLHVIDDGGAPLSDSRVVVKRGAEVLRNERTDASGRLVLESLPTGHASIDVNQPGFRPLVGFRIALRTTCTTALTVMLEVGTTLDHEAVTRATPTRPVSPR